MAITDEQLKDPCAAHTPQPTGYLEWHEWADKKAKTHRQVRCPGCGLFQIWVRK